MPLTLLVAGLAALALSFGYATPGAAANVRAELSHPRITLGQQSQLSVHVSGTQNAGRPRIPEVPGLQIRGAGQSTSMNISGGSISQEIVYNFLVQPLKVGRYQIGPITVPVDGKEQATGTVELAVARAGAAAPAPGGGTQAKADAPAAVLRLAGLPDRPLYVGELRLVEVQLDVRQDVRISEVTQLTVDGTAFTLTQPSGQQPRQSRTRLSGTPYLRYHFPVALSPVAQGAHTLSLQMTATALVQRPRRRRRRSAFDSFFDDSFFGGGREQRALPLATTPSEVEIRGVPEAGRPADYSGAIGQFELTTRATPTELGLGDPVTLESTVTGTGNFDRLSLPPIPASASFRAYDQSARFEASDEFGLRGEKTFEQAIIPERPDANVIPGRSLTFFDPDRGRYVTEKSDPIRLALLTTESAPRVASRTTGSSTAAATGPPVEEFQLAPNHIESGEMSAAAEPLATRIWFLLLQLVPAVLLGLAFRWADERDRREADPRHARRIAANAAITQALVDMDTARARSDAPAFFTAARRALQERLAEDESATALTFAEVENKLPTDPALRQRVQEAFAMADEIAYSGASSDAGTLEKWNDDLRRILASLDADGRSA